MAEFETTFADLGLKAPILEALNDLGYEKPSPHSLYLCCRILILS